MAQRLNHILSCGYAAWMARAFLLGIRLYTILKRNPSSWSIFKMIKHASNLTRIYDICVEWPMSDDDIHVESWSRSGETNAYHLKEQRPYKWWWTHLIQDPYRPELCSTLHDATIRTSGCGSTLSKRDLRDRHRQLICNFDIDSFHQATTEPQQTMTELRRYTVTTI